MSNTPRAKRFHDAHDIWYGGASNPRAIARALVNAIDEATEHAGSDGANDPAVKLILDHLAFLVKLPQPTVWLSMEEHTKLLAAVEAGMLENPR